MGIGRVCRLCLNELAVLVRSHILPRHCYQRIQSDGENFLVEIQDGRAIKTSRHATEYLLCAACDQHFSSEGENYFARISYRRDKARPALNVLLESEISRPGFPRSVTFLEDQIDRHQVAHFALGVIWKAAVSSKARVNLGKYSEEVRRYLLGDVPFPSTCALIVSIFKEAETALADPSLVITLPYMKRADGYHVQAFECGGFAFKLFVGSMIPLEFRRLCVVNSETPVIGLLPSDDAEYREKARVAVHESKKHF